MQQTQIPQQILNKLDALAEKLGVTVQYLWAVLIKQARIEVVESLILVVCFSVATFGLWKILRLLLNKIKEESFPGDSLYFASGGTIIAMAVLTVVSIYTLIDTITPLFNPEYWALQQVLQVLK